MKYDVFESQAILDSIPPEMPAHDYFTLVILNPKLMPQPGFYCRHHATMFSELRMLQGRSYNHPLCKQGKKTAQDEAEKFLQSDEGSILNIIFTSPALRAVETALFYQAVNPDITIYLIPDLIEQSFGRDDGKHIDEVLVNQEHMAWVKNPFSIERSRGYQSPHGGESLASYLTRAARSQSIIHDFMKISQTTPAEAMLISHAGQLRARVFLQTLFEKFALPEQDRIIVNYDQIEKFEMLHAFDESGRHRKIHHGVNRNFDLFQK